MTASDVCCVCRRSSNMRWKMEEDFFFFGFGLGVQ